MDRRTLLAGAVAGVAGTVAGCLDPSAGTWASEPFESTHPIDDGAAVEVANRNGPVAVQPIDGDAVVVRGERRARSAAALGAIDVRVDAGDPFVVTAALAAGDDWSNRQVDLTVGLPAGTRLAEAGTVNGDLAAGAVAGDPYVHTTNGTVEVDGVAGFVRAASTNGDVAVREAGGVDGARSRNGSLDLSIDALRRDVTCETVTGDVRAVVGDGVVATLRLRTGSGAIDLGDLPVTVVGRTDGSLDGHLRGADGPTLSLVTTDGDVRVDPP